MVMTTGVDTSLWHEHQVLLTEYGRAQLRCSRALAKQAAHINELEKQVMKLRADVMLRDTALAWQREDHARLMVAHRDLPKRFALARHIDRLTERLQGLLRERNAAQWWQLPAAPSSAAPSSATSMSGTSTDASATSATSVAPIAMPSVVPAGSVRSVLCVGGDASSSGATRAAVETAGGRFLQHDGSDQAVLEASLVAADLVICQTGCVSHDAFWRVRDHCRRTGKQCVLVDQPDALDAIRASKQPVGL